MALRLAHPELPSCADCQEWLYDSSWKRSTRGGQPQKRPPGSPLPCKLCPKIPLGQAPVPHNATELSPRNLRAYWYYLQCQVDSQGVLPQDEVTVRNNALIDNAVRQHDRAQAGAAGLLLALLGKVR